jgi:hypothetical protein
MKEGSKHGHFIQKTKKTKKQKKKPLLVSNNWCPPNTLRNFLECFTRQLTLEVGSGHHVQNPFERQ